MVRYQYVLVFACIFIGFFGVTINEAIAPPDDCSFINNNIFTQYGDRNIDALNTEEFNISSQIYWYGPVGSHINITTTVPQKYDIFPGTINCSILDGATLNNIHYQTDINGYVRTMTCEFTTTVYTQTTHANTTFNTSTEYVPYDESPISWRQDYTFYGFYCGYRQTIYPTSILAPFLRIPNIYFEPQYWLVFNGRAIYANTGLP